MSRLNKLYQTMDNLKELGLSINEEHEVRAIGEEKPSKRCFSVLDVIGNVQDTNE